MISHGSIDILLSVHFRARGCISVRQAYCSIVKHMQWVMNRACAHGKMPFNRLLSGKRSSGANSMWVLVNGITWNAMFFLVVIQYSVCCFYSPLILCADVCMCVCVCVCVLRWLQSLVIAVVSTVKHTKTHSCSSQVKYANETCLSPSCVSAAVAHGLSGLNLPSL